ncbi:MAG: multifunctional CCA addition/repair protein [Methylophaga sp.]
MEIYQVGGCVRDRLLGLPVNDHDWVVVGADAQIMLSQGYRPVGKDFPVFLHPQTHEEYALARTERKTAPGYRGFAFYAASDVSLEDDLQRRDLTINAMAQTEAGDIIDPFGGQQDLRAGLLRHVSPAFAEDPVRVLRLARFAARFGFQVADDTKQLISQMINAGELDHLVAERVWQETAKALSESTPSRFFYALREVGALPILFPEINRLFGVPQHPKWHPEVDTGVHVMLVLDQAAKLSNDLAVRFASLCHDLGKGETPADILPSHQDHETRSIKLTQQLCKRLKVPRDMQTLAVKVAELHTEVHRLFTLPADTVLAVFEKLDSFRRPERFSQYLLAGEADFRGRPGYETAEMPEKTVFQACFDAASAVKTDAFVKAGMQGLAIAEALKKARLQAIDSVLAPYRNQD